MKHLIQDPSVTIDSYCEAFGISWRGHQIWLAAGSPLNPCPRAPLPLVLAYDHVHPMPPTPEDIATIVSELAGRIRAEDSAEFDIYAALLRATARDYYER